MWLSFFDFQQSTPDRAFMAKKTTGSSYNNNSNANRGRQTAGSASPFEEARDELFQHVMQCGVIGAEAEHQGEWFDQTMSYMTDRYPELSPAQLKELRTLGERFAQPPKGRATATSAA
jgi:hypothetical protein